MRLVIHVNDALTSNTNNITNLELVSVAVHLSNGKKRWKFALFVIENVQSCLTFIFVRRRLFDRWTFVYVYIMIKISL